MPKGAYIYALIDPSSGEVRYVGKTTDPRCRLRRHRTEQGHNKRHKWLKELTIAGQEPQLRILEQTDQESWQGREQWWIAHMRLLGNELVNETIGGNGSAGLAPSPQTRAKISQSVKVAWRRNPRGISADHLAALVAGRRRTPQSLETRRKIGAGNKGKKRSPEVRKAISDAKRGVSWGRHTRETRAVLSRQKSGTKNPMAKLTEEAVKEIRRRYAKGGISLSILAKEYQIDTKQIHRIVRREAWIHV